MRLTLGILLSFYFAANTSATAFAVQGAAPEPMTLILLGSALIGLFGASRSQRPF